MRNNTVLILLTLSLTLTANIALAVPPTRPNIVLIMTDDQGYAQLNAHGHPWLQTPHLDQLHRQSTRFTRFYVEPTCAPTRSALMTGREPFKNGVTHTIHEQERMTLDVVTLPELLSQAGYESAIFGKWHLGDEDPYQPQQRGFDHAFIHGGGGIGQSYKGSCADAPGNSYFDPVMRENGMFVKTQGFCTDVIFDAALEWITQQAQSPDPYFAYIATNAPHAPFLATPDDKKRFLRMGFDETQASFYGMIENIDRNLGRLLQHLAATGQDENTLVIFLSDNGTVGNGAGFKEKTLGTDANGQALAAYNAGMKGAKGTLDEGGCRVPMFVRWTGVVPEGRDIDRIAAHIDLLPTLCGLVNVDVPSGQVVGRNLWPLILNSDHPWDDRLLFTHLGRWKLQRSADDDRDINYAVRSQNYLLTFGKKLYDLGADPGQTTNIYHAHPDVTSRMEAAYQNFWEQSRPLMVNENVTLATTQPFTIAFEKQRSESGIPHRLFNAQ